jgi:hypothetical protein
LKVAKKISFIGTNKNAFFVLFIFILLLLLSENNDMFWDPVLFASKMGSKLYYNLIFNWIILDSFDSRHLPFVGFLLAIFWKIFNYELWDNRLLILPFIIGLFYQLYPFINHYRQKGSIVFLRFLIIITYPNLAKLPCYSLIFKAVDYLTKKKIEMESVLSFLPNNRALNYIDFKNEKRAFQEFNKKNEYVFYSNI